MSGRSSDWPAWQRRPACPTCRAPRGYPCVVLGETTAAASWGLRPGDDLANPHRDRRVDRVSNRWRARMHLEPLPATVRPRSSCLASRPGSLVTVLCVRVRHDDPWHRGPGDERWCT